MVLPMQTIQTLIQRTPPLVEGFISIEEQLQSNGIDLTLRDISIMTGAGKISAGQERKLSETTPVSFGPDNWTHLAPGAYLITYNEVVRLPPDIMAIGRPRSSLLRCGVSIGAAVWDAGYSGRSQSLLTVHNPAGFAVQKNARVLQLVFIRLEAPTAMAYHGRFQEENI